MTGFLTEPGAVQRIWHELQALKARVDSAITGAGRVRSTGGGGHSTGVPPTHDHTGTGEGGPLYGHHTYSFLPDAAQGDDVELGDQQGKLHLSGESEETVVLTLVHAETAPTGASLDIELEYVSTATDNEYWDLDKVTGWTTIDTVSLPIGHKSVLDETPTVATIPARRLIRLNVDQIGSTVAGKDASVDLRVRRVLETS